MGLLDEDELFEQIDECGWPGYWFTHACKAADILQILRPDEPYSDLGDEAWSTWVLRIDWALEQLTGQVDETSYQLMISSWLIGGQYLGNRKPRNGDNLLASTVLFTEEELRVRILVKRTLNRHYGNEEEMKALLSE